MTQEEVYRTTLARYGYKSDGVIAPGSCLRLEQAIVTTKANYSFPLLANEGAPFNTEVRLNLTDVFLAYGLQIFLAVPGSATDAAYKLLSYPNPIKFAAATDVDAEVIYNGQLSVTTNNINFLSSWPLSKHRAVYTSQERAIADPPAIANDEFYGNETSLSPVSAPFTFSGSLKTDIQIILPAAVATAQAFSRIVMMWHGVLANNASNVAGVGGRP